MGVVSSLFAFCKDTIKGKLEDNIKGELKNYLNERELEDEIEKFIEVKAKENEVCTVDEEIDFGKLCDYLRGNILDDVKRYIEVRGKDRARLKKDIINKAVAFSSADTRLSRERAEAVTVHAIEIIYGFCRSSDYLSDRGLQKLLIGEAVEDILGAQTQNHSEVMQEIGNARKEIGNARKEIGNARKDIQDLSDRVDNYFDSRERDENYNPSTESDFINRVKEYKQPFIDMLSKRLFLHRKSSDDNVTLNSTFIFPSYTDNEQNEHDNLEDYLISFITYDSCGTLLITGEPGIGKSSLVAKILEPYNGSDKNEPTKLATALKEYNANDSIIVLKCTDLEDYNKTKILDAVFAALNCTKKDLANKVLILDGFDELEDRTLIDNLEDFLVEIYKIEGYKLIITSREHYINITSEFDKHIKLKAFSEDKIFRYYTNR